MEWKITFVSPNSEPTRTNHMLRWFARLSLSGNEDVVRVLPNSDDGPMAQTPGADGCREMLSLFPLDH